MVAVEVEVVEGTTEVDEEGMIVGVGEATTEAVEVDTVGVETEDETKVAGTLYDIIIICLS